jgi:hypothetical protein
MPMLTRRQAAAIKQRDDLLEALRARDNEVAGLKQVVGRLQTELDRLHVLIDQAQAAGWKIDTPAVRPDVLMETIKERAAMRREKSGHRYRSPKGTKPDTEPYDVTWQVEGIDGTDTQRPDT